MAAFGSAGDLFPLMPLVARLQSEDHDVRAAVSRSLGLYVRSRGVRVHPQGSGAEMRIFEDERAITNRFGGWASWRHLLTTYVLPSLRDDVERLGQVFAEWRPDVVVTGSFSPAARVAAHLHEVPCIEATIYPQHPNRLRRAGAFGLALRKAVAQFCDSGDGPASDVVSDLAWGASPDGIVLHDRAVLGGLDGIGELVGFPYWDEGLERPGDGDDVERWLDASTGPVVAVTLGSFLGGRQQHVWAEAAKVVESLGVRAVFVGLRGRWEEVASEVRADVLTVGFVPLSRIASRVDAVVHHGGVGTMFGVLGAGRPAVVVPQAYDQSFNAALVERAGVGVDGSARSLHDALAAVLDDPRYRATAQSMARELIPSETATERLLARVRAQLAM